MNTGFRKRRRGILAATSTLVVAAGIAVVSVAGAAEDTTIFVSDKSGTPCFATTPDQPPCAADPVSVTVETGDEVTWEFAGSTMPHNVAADPDSPSDAPDDDWKKFKTPGKGYHNPGEGGTDSYVFGKAGVYRYVCALHPKTMKGTITVTGEEVETHDPDDEDDEETPQTPSATATPTVIASAT